jgi:hypothetical protein
VQHDASEIARGVGREDVSGEALFDQIRKVAAVVDVGVAEDHGID